MARFCVCQRRILTLQQERENLPCDVCQAEGKRHAEEFHQLYDIKEENGLPEETKEKLKEGGY